MATVPSSGQYGPSLTSVNFSFYMKEVAYCSQGSSAAPFTCVCLCVCNSDLPLLQPPVCVSEGCGDTHLCDRAGQQINHYTSKELLRTKMD